MDRGYEKEAFVSFKIKATAAKKFRNFSKSISRSQSMTMLLMVEFFENNGISPTENIGPKMQTLENLIKKRINGVIAILKAIEKTQTKPTKGMLMALMEQPEPPKKSLMIEKKRLLSEDNKYNPENKY